MSEKTKLWGGRFTQETDELFEEFNASVGFDKRLFSQDIDGSIAHATMLHEVGILTAEEKTKIIDGLNEIRVEIQANRFQWRAELEDVHMNIEAQLTTKIGDTGKKLHTARSRNDQVATDLRLYLRQVTQNISHQILNVLEALSQLAGQHTDTIMPGFTHMQCAQPVTFGHHLMAWSEMLERDLERLHDCLKRMNRCPLGSAALAGTSFDIDRHLTSQLLGFDEPCRNSLDAVSDRDFVIELSSVSALLMMHLSRCCEELIIWSSAQFNFIELSDDFCTGSSIMPQKKNPDIPELIRGKSGRVYGHLFSLLTLMKSQPLAYNKDNQEDKEPIFDTVDTVILSLDIFSRMLKAVSVNQEAMYQAATRGYATATDYADYLVRQGIPFREAHEIVGKTVRYCIDNQKALESLTLTELQQFTKQVDEAVFESLTLEGSVAARNHFGGTAPAQVKAQLKQLADRVAQYRKNYE